MPVKFIDAVRRYLGWCPNTSAVRTHRTKAIADPVSTSTAVPAAPQGGTPAAGNDRYSHTQKSVILPAVSILIILLIGIPSTFLAGGATQEALLIFGFVVVILTFAILMFATLTVSVKSDILEIRFGPIGVVKRSFRLSDFVSCHVVKNPWWYGYGIRYTPHGTLYNVAGQGAVEILLISGRSFRVGTDEPEALAKAIRAATPLSEQ